MAAGRLADEAPHDGLGRARFFYDSVGRYNLDKAWDNIVSRIAGVELQHDKTLDEQFAAAAQREKLQKEIAKLEKLARAEKQPKRKFELVQRIKTLRNDIELL